MNSFKQNIKYILSPQTQTMKGDKGNDCRLLKQLYSKINNHSGSRVLSTSDIMQSKPINPILCKVSHQMMGKSIFTKTLKNKKYWAMRKSEMIANKSTGENNNKNQNGNNLFMNSTLMKQSIWKIPPDQKVNGKFFQNITRIKQEPIASRRAKTLSSTCVNEQKKISTPLLIIKSQKDKFKRYSEDNSSSLRKKNDTVSQNKAKDRARSAYFTSRKKKLSSHEKTNNAQQLDKHAKLFRTVTEGNKPHNGLTGWETGFQTLGTLRISKQVESYRENTDEDPFYQNIDDIEVYL